MHKYAAYMGWLALWGTLRGEIVAQVSPSYHVVRRLVVDSAGADFLAVDVKNRRLYGMGYKIFDIDKLTVVGALPARSGHGYVLAGDLDKGLTRKGVFFQLSSGLVNSQISINGDAGAYEPRTRRAFFFNADTVTVVDMKTGQIIGTPRLRDHGILGLESAVADGSGNVFVSASAEVADSGQAQVVRLDAATLQVTAQWPLDGCSGPQGLDIDRVHSRVFVACDRSLFILDSRDGHHVMSVDVAGHADELAYDQSSRLIFSPNDNGTMALIHEDSPNQYHVVQLVEAASAGGAVALDASTHRAFMFVSRRGDPNSELLVLQSQ